MQGLIKLIDSYKLSTRTEKEFQSDLEQVFLAERLDFIRECALCPGDIVDFLVGGVAIECKTKGSSGNALHQLSRYAMSSKVEGLLLVTTRASHRKLDGITLNGKAVRVVWCNNL